MNYESISHTQVILIFTHQKKLSGNKSTAFVTDGASAADQDLDKIYQQLTTQYKSNKQTSHWLVFKELEAHIATKIEDCLTLSDTDIFLFFDKVLGNFEILYHFMPHAHYEGLECEAAALFLKRLQSTELNHQDTYNALADIKDIHRLLLRFERCLASKRNRVFSATLMGWLYKLSNWLSDSIDLDQLLPGIHASESEINVAGLERYIQIIGLKQAYKFRTLHYLQGSDLLSDGSPLLAELEASLKELTAHQSKFIQSRLEISEEFLTDEKVSGLCHYAFVLTMATYFGPLDSRLNPLFDSEEVSSLLLKQSDPKLYKELWKQLLTQGKRASVTDLKKYFKEGDLSLLSLCWGLGETEQARLKEEILSDYEHDGMKLLRMCSPNMGLWVLENLLTLEECHEIVERAKALNSEALIAENEQGLVTIFKYIYRTSSGEVGSKRLRRFLSGLKTNSLEIILKSLLGSHFKLLYGFNDGLDKAQGDHYKLAILLHCLENARLGSGVLNQGQLYYYLFNLKHHAITRFLIDRLLSSMDVWSEFNNYYFNRVYHGFNLIGDLRNRFLSYLKNLWDQDFSSKSQVDSLNFLSRPEHYLNRGFFSSIDGFEQLATISHPRLRCAILKALLSPQAIESDHCSIANKLKLLISNIAKSCDMGDTDGLTEYQTFFKDNDYRRLVKLLEINQKAVLENKVFKDKNLVTRTEGAITLSIATQTEKPDLLYSAEGVDYEWLIPIFTSILYESSDLLAVMKSQNICAQHQQLIVLMSIIRRSYFKDSSPKSHEAWESFFTSLNHLMTPCLQALNKETRHNFLNYFSSIDFNSRSPIFFDLFADSVPVELQYVRCYLLGQVIHACDPHLRLLETMKSYMSNVMLRVTIRLKHFDELLNYFLFIEDNNETPISKKYIALFNAYVNCKDVDTTLIFRQRFLEDDMKLLYKIGENSHGQAVMDAIMNDVFTADVKISNEVNESTPIRKLLMDIPACRRSIICSNNYEYLKNSDGNQAHFDKILADFFDIRFKKDLCKMMSMNESANLYKIINAIAVHISPQLFVELFAALDDDNFLCLEDFIFLEDSLSIESNDNFLCYRLRNAIKRRLLSHDEFSDPERLKEIFKCYFNKNSNLSYSTQLSKTEHLRLALSANSNPTETKYVKHSDLNIQKAARDHDVLRAINIQALIEVICPDIKVVKDDKVVVDDENQRKKYNSIQDYYYRTVLKNRYGSNEKPIDALINKKNQDGTHFLSMHYIDIRPKENQVNYGFFARLVAAGNPTIWYESPRDRYEKNENPNFGDFVLSEVSGIEPDY